MEFWTSWFHMVANFVTLSCMHLSLQTETHLIVKLKKESSACDDSEHFYYSIWIYRTALFSRISVHWSQLIRIHKFFWVPLCSLGVRKNIYSYKITYLDIHCAMISLLRAEHRFDLGAHCTELEQLLYQDKELPLFNTKCVRRHTHVYTFLSGVFGQLLARSHFQFFFSWRYFPIFFFFVDASSTVTQKNYSRTAHSYSDDRLEDVYVRQYLRKGNLWRNYVRRGTSVDHKYVCV